MIRQSGPRCFYRLSITEVITPYVSLKRAGRNFIGLCPFHAEKTPSFTVSDERGLYHCFGCGESGTVFTFVMKMAAPISPPHTPSACSPAVVTP